MPAVGPEESKSVVFLLPRCHSLRHVTSLCTIQCRIEVQISISFRSLMTKSPIYQVLSGRSYQGEQQVVPLKNQPSEVDKANQPNHGTLTLRQCDESKPVCRNCNRHAVSCIYENATKFSSKSPLPHSTSTERPHEEIDLLGDYRGASSSLVLLDLEAEFAQEMTHSSEVDESNVLDDLESKISAFA